jgi:hypothetical protein
MQRVLRRGWLCTKIEKFFMPINKVFELGRRAVRKELIALRGERIGDEGEGGKGGIIIPKDKFKEFEEFQKRMRGRKIKEIGGSSKGVYIRTIFGYTEVSGNGPN